VASTSVRGAKRRNENKRLATLTECEAELIFCESRWGLRDKQGCPKCGRFAEHYRIRTRRQWRCIEVGCRHTFSAKSGTKLDNSKLSYKKILELIAAFAGEPKGITLASLARQLCITEKTAHQMQMKIREAITNSSDRSPLSGLVQIDGAYFCGKFRKANRRAKATALDVLSRHGKPLIRSRLNVNYKYRGNCRRALNKRVIIALTEVSPASNPVLANKTDDPRKGISRVIVATCYSENSEDIQALVEKYVKRGTRIFTDESAAYNGLANAYEHHVVNHSVEYSTAEGVSDNMAESHFSRGRRAQYGVHHGMRPQYLEFYAWEWAWRETRRIYDQTANCRQLLEWLLSPGYSDYWRGYHGGNKRKRSRRPRNEIVMGDRDRAMAVARREARKFVRSRAGEFVPRAPLSPDECASAS